MVNTVSTRAKLLSALRKQAGKPLSGGILARDLHISRVAVWKGIQALIGAGYPIETRSAGYSLDPEKANDFLYPWEFGENEAMFRYFDSTDSTMDRAREFAQRGLAAGTVITAEKQSAGRGRNGSAWASRQGGLFCTILERPGIALADYYLPAMLFHIAAARALASLCGKPARLRWPNDIYIGKRKIAGLVTELAGESDRIDWLTIGIGVNVNNTVPSEKAVSCAGITGHTVSRREVLLKIINEADHLKKRTRSGMAYAQGNRLLAAEWNSLADGRGAKAAVTDSSKIFARGIFAGIDPAGRCIIKSETGKGALYFNPGPVSVVLYGEKK
ncbi:MAG: biotin--[acetyl-CoA-carboxylase] ligase [Treponema sp.]|jgi:BirA family biotin operon repressor/biotin-[acetyl-CoA-carboxylase] ligase|nr:biotin--[acetyl-CoA-carboxylase] ligase [Treponema sp.]